MYLIFIIKHPNSSIAAHSFEPTNQNEVQVDQSTEAFPQPLHWIIARLAYANNWKDVPVLDRYIVLCKTA